MRGRTTPKFSGGWWPTSRSSSAGWISRWWRRWWASSPARCSTGRTTVRNGGDQVSGTVMVEFQIPGRHRFLTHEFGSLDKETSHVVADSVRDLRADRGGD